MHLLLTMAYKVFIFSFLLFAFTLKKIVANIIKYTYIHNFLLTAYKFVSLRVLLGNAKIRALHLGLRHSRQYIASLLNLRLRIWYKLYKIVLYFFALNCFPFKLMINKVHVTDNNYHRTAQMHARFRIFAFAKKSFREQKVAHWCGIL